MLKSLSQVLGFGITVLTMMETVHADSSFPCWPNCGEDYNQTCQEAFGNLWYYCGDAPPDSIWCCEAGG